MNKNELQKKKTKKNIADEIKAKEKLILENVNKEVKSIQFLQDELEVAKNSYKEACKNSETMQNLLNDSIVKNVGNEISQQLSINLNDLREKEKIERQKLDELHAAIEKKNSEVIKIAVQKRKNTVDKTNSSSTKRKKK